MPTIGFTGSCQRSDTILTTDLFTIAPSTTVAEDAIKTISLTNAGGASPSQVVAFGNVSQASLLYMVSNRQLSVVLSIPGPTALTAFKARYLIIDTTEIVAATITNLDTADAAEVRFLIGGAA